MKPKNPLAYVEHLRGAGTDIRRRVERAAELQGQMERIAFELATLEAEVTAIVSAHWSAEEIREARADCASK